MAIPAASARAISKHFGATRALDRVDFDCCPARSTRSSARTARANRRSCASWPARTGRMAARSHRRAGAPVRRPARGDRRRHRHHPAGTAARARAFACRKYHAGRSAAAASVRRAGRRSLPHARGGEARSWRSSALPPIPRCRLSAELCRAAARCHRQGVAAAAAAS